MPVIDSRRAGRGAPLARSRTGPERSGGMGPWPLRVVWLLLPLTVGGALEHALDGRSSAVGTTASVLAWAAWVLSLLATFVAHPAGLTVLRVTGPAAAAVATLAVLDGRPAWWVSVLALLVGFAAAALAVAPETADRCVDGAAYGSERRFALRIPLPLLLGPVPLAWLVVVAGAAAGPLLLACGRWALGGAVLVAGWAAAFLAARAVHGLSQRFVVLVPAGLVLHDRAALVDPVLFTRDVIGGLGPAMVGTAATDLTLRAAGLVLELRLVRTLEIPLRQGRDQARAEPVDAVLFNVLRPAQLLDAAAANRIPIG